MLQCRCTLIFLGGCHDSLKQYTYNDEKGVVHVTRISYFSFTGGVQAEVEKFSFAVGWGVDRESTDRSCVSVEGDLDGVILCEIDGVDKSDLDFEGPGRATLKRAFDKVVRLQSKLPEVSICLPSASYSSGLYENGNKQRAKWDFVRVR